MGRASRRKKERRNPGDISTTEPVDLARVDILDRKLRRAIYKVAIRGLGREIDMGDPKSAELSVKGWLQEDNCLAVAISGTFLHEVVVSVPHLGWRLNEKPRPGSLAATIKSIEAVANTTPKQAPVRTKENAADDHECTSMLFGRDKGSMNAIKQFAKEGRDIKKRIGLWLEGDDPFFMFCMHVNGTSLAGGCSDDPDSIIATALSVTEQLGAEISRSQLITALLPASMAQELQALWANAGGLQPE